MQAKELYSLGCRAYNGDRAAGREWLALLAPVVMPIAAKYLVLPSFVLAKAITESGWASDIYEGTLNSQFGAPFSRKAQSHNNILGMCAFEANQKRLPEYAAPAWDAYKETFTAMATHYDAMGGLYVKEEKWKHYRSVEDAVEDFCQNIRFQAEAAGRQWRADIRSQLLASESYTPEGKSEGVREGLHFWWQEQVMRIYEEYGLSQYDEKAVMEKMKLTTKVLDAHIAAAHRYAHAYCGYGPTDTHYPPGETGIIDCVGLVFRALYTTGWFPRMANINQVVGLCEAAGLQKSTDEGDVWRHHGVACYQDSHLKGTAHVSHVYYSLGGTGLSDISKYDLGSNERIRAGQPFTHVPTNEWQGKRHFLCFFYVPDGKREDEPPFTSFEEAPGLVVKKVGMYAGPGTSWRKLGTLAEGAAVTLRGAVTNDKGKAWMAIRRGKTEGYVYHNAVQKVSETYTAVASGMEDGVLSVRVSPGGFKLCEMKAGETATVLGRAKAGDGSLWLRVKYGKLYGYVSEMFIKRK